MKNRFFGTFLSGAERIVAEMLAQRLKDVEIRALLDGAVEFATAVPYSDLNLFCFNNLFLVLHKGEAGSGEDVLDGYLRQLPASDADWEEAARHPAKVKTFRLVTSRENRLTAVDRGLRDRLEKRIAGLSGLRVDRSRPDAEFWLLARIEGTCYFLKRLSRHTAYDKLLDPGELHPELAYMMCWLTRPKHTDVAVDPFCGCGAIPLQRCKRFPFSRLYAFDLNEKPLARTLAKLPRRPGEIFVERQDALELAKALGPESVDAVITDPPWGLFESVGMELSRFYEKMLGQFSAVLKPSGTAVILTAGKDELLLAAEEHPEFALADRYDILVSGKKCGLFVFTKAA